jgi:hypothetical protein
MSPARGLATEIISDLIELGVIEPTDPRLGRIIHLVTLQIMKHAAETDEERGAA